MIQSTIRLLEKALCDRNVAVDITAVFQSLPARQQNTPVQASLNDDAAPNGGLSGQTEGFGLIVDDGEVGDGSLVSHPHKRYTHAQRVQTRHHVYPDSPRLSYKAWAKIDAGFRRE